MLAAYVAIAYMGGPQMPYSRGRVDAKDGSVCELDGRLPDGAQTLKHVRTVFTRLGFDDKDTVALIGAYTCGLCHLEYSCFVEPGTHDANGFYNSFFTALLEEKWEVKPKVEQMRMMDCATTKPMILPSDMAPILTPKCIKYVGAYARGNDRFNSDFTKAFNKLTEPGTTELHNAPVVDE